MRCSPPASGSRSIPGPRRVDRKSTRLNSSHSQISYAVFCLKKKKIRQTFSSAMLGVHPYICKYIQHLGAVWHSFDMTHSSRTTTIAESAGPGGTFKEQCTSA